MIVRKVALLDGPVTPGDSVTFDVLQTASGPEAANVRILNVSAVQAQDYTAAPKRCRSNAPGAFVGSVKSFVASTGYGFIACPETERLYGKDVFVRKDILPGGSAKSGDLVSFNVVDGQSGPEAANVQILQDASGLRRGEILFGEVKSYDEAKGWGFVTSEYAFQLYGKDVFVMREAAGRECIHPGALVSFQVDMTPKGPQAVDLRVLPPASFSSPSSPDSRLLCGVVKSFVEQKGYGFVTSDEIQNLFRKDIFLHVYDLRPGEMPSPGDEVRFKVELGTMGQLVAKSVELQSGGGGHPPPQGPRVQRQAIGAVPRSATGAGRRASSV
eukprot:TRINITY_DN11342_c0_g1_i2.p1 TRINITY_DN11342_c0_g1~~TRINITY_DN11342_c0_g1_i2.p1  ORF type:complete len:328 (-),score=55.29 TRINITY_DN11342_c0_g1_i2:12-995(-)